jgi:hypothetical protein
MSPRGRGVAGVSSNDYSCAHGAQVNFGDLTQNLTYGMGNEPNPYDSYTVVSYKSLNTCSG